MEPLIVVVRLLQLLLTLLVVPFDVLYRELTVALDERPTHLRVWGESLARALERLGAAFVKLGQVLSTRPDILPGEFVLGLARLQDQVRAVPWAQIKQFLDDSWPSRSQYDIDPTPVATGSVAQVHSARDAAGRRYAIKVKRPTAALEIDRDLGLIRAIGKLLARFEALAFLQPNVAIETFATSLEAQLDFRVEAQNSVRFRESFAREQEIAFPEVLAEHSTADVLVMEWIDGLPPDDPRVLSRCPEAKIELAEAGARAILKMVFRDHLVHADLHPGNVLVASDNRLVFLDTGLVAQIPESLIVPWIDTFSALAAKDAKRAAELFYIYAPVARVSNYDEYEREVSSYLAHLFEAKLGDIEVFSAVFGMMQLLRRHGVAVQQAYTSVNVALVVAEGLGKMLYPDIDLVALAIPYLLEARWSGLPPGEPLRQVPERKRG